MAYEDTIRLYRGNKSGLPTVLDGEPVWAHDTGELYVGGRYGNVRIGYGITPEAYGAKGDGVTDDTAAIQAAVDACANGGTVLFAAGRTYLISSKIVVKHPVNLIGHGRDTVIKLNAPVWPNNMIFDLESEIASSLNVTDASLTQGQQTITVAATTGLAAEQTVLLLYGEDPYDANEEFLRAFLKIKSISGNDVTFYTGIPEAVAAAADVHSLNILTDLVENIVVIGFAFDYGTGTPNNAIRVLHCRNIDISNIFAIKSPGILIDINESENIHAHSIFVDKQTLVHSNAVTFFFWGNRNCTLKNIYCKSVENCYVIGIESQERDLEVSDVYIDANNTDKVVFFIAGGSLNIRMTNITVNLLAAYVLDSVADSSQVVYDNWHIYGTATSILAENVKNRITYGGTVYEKPVRSTIYFKIPASGAPAYVGVPAGIYKMVRAYASSLTGLTSIYLIDSHSHGADFLSSLVAGSWATLPATLYRLGSSYNFNDDTTKYLAIYSDATVPANTYGILEIEYWPVATAPFPSVVNESLTRSVDVGGTMDIEGNVDIAGNIFIPNAKKIYSKTTAGVDSDLVALWSDNFLYIGYDQDDIVLRGNTTYGREKLRVDQYGNVHVGATYGIGTSAGKNVIVENGTAPSTSPTDKFAMYSADIVAGNAAPHFRTENGTVIKLDQAIDTTASPTFADINATGAYSVGGLQVVGARVGAISAPSGGGVQDAEARTAINSILAALLQHGLIGEVVEAAGSVAATSAVTGAATVT